MKSVAPRAFNREMYHDHPENVFYGTDDGEQDGSFGEFAAFRAHYEGVLPVRRDDIHMVSVVGGLYGLNLIPLWRPKRLTFFDINPTAVAYFRIIRRLFLASRDVEDFLRRLTEGDYAAETESEEFVRENIRLRKPARLLCPAPAVPRSGPTPRAGRSPSRTSTWTRQILREAPLEIRTEPMESEILQPLDT